MWLQTILEYFRPPLVRDASGRYVSPDGYAYEITVTALAGRFDAVEVTLRGDPVIPQTTLPGLTLLVAPKPRVIQAAIRYLLRSADRLSRRFNRLREEELPIDKPKETELEITEAIVERLIERLQEERVLPPTEYLESR